MRVFWIFLFTFITPTALADYCSTTNFEKGKELITKYQKIHNEQIKKYNLLLKAPMSYDLLTKDHSYQQIVALWQEASPEFDRILKGASDLDAQYVAMVKKEKTVIKGLDTVSRLFERLAEYCFEEDEYVNSRSAKNNRKMMLRSIKDVEEFVISINKARYPLVKEINTIKQVMQTPNIDWSSIATQTATKGEDWSITGDIKYKVALKYCERYGQISVKIEDSAIQYTRDGAQMQGLTVSLAKNIDGSQWDSFHESQKLTISKVHHQQAAVVVKDQQLIIKDANCADFLSKGFPKTEDPGWLVFKALMKGGGYVPIHASIR